MPTTFQPLKLSAISPRHSCLQSPSQEPPLRVFMAIVVKQFLTPTLTQVLPPLNTEPAERLLLTSGSNRYPWCYTLLLHSCCAMLSLDNPPLHFQILPSSTTCYSLSQTEVRRRRVPASSDLWLRILMWLQISFLATTNKLPPSLYKFEL